MSSPQESLSRDMSLFDITMIGVGAMIGAGIFVLTGDAAGIAGPALILSFALNGIVTIFTAMVYAELGSAIPEAGGGYLWVKEGLPGANAFLAGWMSWFAHAVAGALYALGFGAFVYELLRILHFPLLRWGIEFGLAKKGIGLLVVLFFAYINFRGASETGLAGNIVTLAKIAVIGVFCFFGLKFMFFPDLLFSVTGAEGGMGTRQLQPFIPDETGWLGILSAMGLTFIAFEGYEIIVQAGEEVEEPRRNIPKAVFWSLAIVVPIYMLVAFVLVGASQSGLLLQALSAIGEHVPGELTASSPNWKILKHVGELGLARAAAQFVPYGAVMILLGGLLSTMSALNATTFSSTRVAFAMGRDRNLPDVFANIHSWTKTPHIALLFTALLIGVMVAFVPITTVAAAADIMFLLLFLQVNVAVITIRKKYGDQLAYGYLMPFYPLVPVIGIITKLALALFMFDHYPAAWLYVLIWLAVGFALFRLYARPREREKEAPPVVAEERTVEIKPHSVLIPVADPESAKQHVKIGGRIAQRLNSQLVLLHLVKIPRQLPASASSKFVQEARPTMDEVRAFAESEFDVPVTTLIRAGRNVAKAIIHTAKEEDTEYVIMGWKGETFREETQVGSNIDWVLKQVNAHSIVMEKGPVVEHEDVLVPIANPDSAGFAVAVSSLFAQNNISGSLTLLHVESTMDEAAREAYERKLNQILSGEGEPLDLLRRTFDFRIEFMEHTDPVQAIVERSAEYDRLVLGTTQGGGLLQRRVIGAIPSQVVNQSACPVVLIRQKELGVKFEVQNFFQFFRDLEDEPPE